LGLTFNNTSITGIITASTAVHKLSMTFPPKTATR
jgi:hypothetical protein